MNAPVDRLKIAMFGVKFVANEILLENLVPSKGDPGADTYHRRSEVRVVIATDQNLEAVNQLDRLFAPIALKVVKCWAHETAHYPERQYMSNISEV